MSIPRLRSVPRRLLLHHRAYSAAVPPPAPEHQQQLARDDAFLTALDTPTARYRQLISKGVLRQDDHQKGIIAKLQKLNDELKGYQLPAIPSRSLTDSFGATSFFSRLLVRPAPAPAPSSQGYSNSPKSLYLYGSVGTGKSMLMDLFHDTLRTHSKERIHFHAFMVDVHKRVHRLKMQGGEGDLAKDVAREVARGSSVVCFDEFQVTDIADAMILRRLLEELLGLGVVFVMTSNRHPDDLYKNGIQRASFIPCIELIKRRFDIIDLDSGTDYRKIPRELSSVYLSPIDKSTNEAFEQKFADITEGQEIRQNRALPIWGRTLTVPESTTNVAKFDFKDLCGAPLSAADYLEVTKSFGTVFVSNVPRMGLGQKDMARRFITFIDACYESKTILYILSEVPIFEAFSDDRSKLSSETTDHMRSAMDELGLSSDVVSSSSIFTGDEEIFAFARACSRLVQMGTKSWVEGAV
ncbi:hypothetical protein BOTBODRAFT_624928 [Botryobasidium botryosum FD-172 SS1]|uniref:AAA+ ATPase domain-containing protein n=1 Tax=Botryobasidium botryosum (strain FD-172 SS1) TaxID=930990 RepID=A0A067MHX7_BOTB1|nr:hypothetical protein BOTBODRAFT_624928 [Botryobasidium botryosum FD-172 SS1]